MLTAAQSLLKEKAQSSGEAGSLLSNDWQQAECSNEELLLCLILSEKQKNEDQQLLCGAKNI